MPELKEKIQENYLKQLLKTGKEPITVFAFTDEIGISEDDFFNHYRSFRSVEKDVWAGMLLNVQNALEADAEFPEYSAREKSLALFYTLVEVFKQNRSLLLFRVQGLPRQTISPWFLAKFKSEFVDMITVILDEGKDSQEIITRPILSDKYKDAIWIQCVYLMRVWVNDESEEYQTTDAAIEKTVNLAFELMQKGPMDLLIDFAKFAYQNKAY